MLQTIRKHAAALSKAVDRYHERLNVFRQNFPNHLAYPPEIEYAKLFQIQPDDPFWGDGLFTNHNEPWAIDPSTQYGMRQLSYLERSEEELRRIGWEVRREMRWILQTHSRLCNHLQYLLRGILPAGLPEVDNIQCLLNHSILSHVDPQSRKIVAINLLHTRLIRLLHHVRKSTIKFQKVFQGTVSQACDDSLEQEWENLGRFVSSLGEQGMSMIPGCLSLVERLWPVEQPAEGPVEEGRNVVEDDVNLVAVEEEDEDQDADEEEEIVNQTVLTVTEKAVASALDGLALYDDMDDVEY